MSVELDPLVRARSILLDALEALNDHAGSIVVIGAQAIYLHTQSAPLALAPATRDSDLALDARGLADTPRIEQAMAAAGFARSRSAPQPGTWIRDGVPVDLMVPEALAGARGTRGARIPPHSRHSTRRASGIEATLCDHEPMRITALDPADARSMVVNVAGPASLLVSKLHKLAERQTGTPERLRDKDAHDVYRLLAAVDVQRLAADLDRLARDPFAGHVTAAALDHLDALFAAGADAPGSAMAGRAEELVGDSALAAAASAQLARRLSGALSRRRPGC